MKTPKFKYNGSQYYTETRTCSNQNCKCHKGHEHGPYWWLINADGIRKYLGKTPPEDINLLSTNAKAISKKAKLIIQSLQSAIKDLQHKLALLTNFSNQEYLPEKEREEAERLIQYFYKDAIELPAPHLKDL